MLPQRQALVGEFVQAVESRTLGHRTLLSGPCGVGQSAVGLEAHLVCVARGLLVAYLMSAAGWVTAARAGRGDEYLLKKFWEQNADLIAASEPLREVFEGPLRDDEVGFSEATMTKLREGIKAGRLPAAGVIIDVAHHVTLAVAAGDKPVAHSGSRVASAYFKKFWPDWTADAAVFACMSIASSYGVRDFRLPSGEQHRLRILEPLPASIVKTLQESEASPAYVADATVRAHVAYIAGGILRGLVRGASVAREKDGESSAVVRKAVRRALVSAMLDTCDRWLDAMPKGSAEREAAVGDMLRLVRGE